jgi:hypothetical protein
MVRSFRVGALIAFLACTAPGWGQSVQPEQFVTVREEGKPAQKCRVVKCWKEPDGSRVCHVQVVGSNEMMTIVDAKPAPGSSAPAGSRVFSWGKSKASPPGVPVASPKAEVVSTWTETTPRRGVFGKPFGSSSPAVAKNESAKPASADLRQSWGKVDTTTAPEAPKVVQTSGRPELPVASKMSGDPLERPDIYTTAPASMPPVKSDTAPPPLLTESKSVASCTTTGDCGTCTTTPPAKSSMPRPFGLFRSSTQVVKSDSKVETVVVQDKDAAPVVVSEVPSSKPMFMRDMRAAKPKVIKTEVVKVEEVKSPAAAAQHEPHVGVFAGLFNHASSSPAPAPVPEPRSNMPAGMGSVAAAARASTGTAAATPVGAVVRMPDGQHRVVDFYGASMAAASVPMSASNAFTVPGPLPTGYYPSHQTLANAFTLPMPGRPLPYDEATMQRQTANGLDADGMGGAEYRPSLAMAAYQQQMAMAHQAMMAMAYGGMPGAAVAMDQGAVTAQHLAALRQSLMPSERERAVMGLVQVGWKADPQVVPALVVAAQTDPAPAVRVACVRALGQMKAKTLPAVQALNALTKDPDVRIRAEAEQVLPQLTKP